jgi:hypothetical protein
MWVAESSQRQTTGRHHEFLSESPGGLAGKAKAAEDAVAPAREEGREKLQARLTDLRSSAERRQAELA